MSNNIQSFRADRNLNNIQNLHYKLYSLQNGLINYSNNNGIDQVLIFNYFTVIQLFQFCLTSIGVAENESIIKEKQKINLILVISNNIATPIQAIYTRFTENMLAHLYILNNINSLLRQLLVYLQNNQMIKKQINDTNLKLLQTQQKMKNNQLFITQLIQKQQKTRQNLYQITSKLQRKQFDSNLIQEKAKFLEIQIQKQRVNHINAINIINNIKQSVENQLSIIQSKLKTSEHEFQMNKRRNQQEKAKFQDTIQKQLNRITNKDRIIKQITSQNQQLQRKRLTLQQRQRQQRTKMNNTTIQLKKIKVKVQQQERNNTKLKQQLLQKVKAIEYLQTKIFKLEQQLANVYKLLKTAQINKGQLQIQKLKYMQQNKILQAKIDSLGLNKTQYQQYVRGLEKTIQQKQTFIVSLNKQKIDLVQINRKLYDEIVVKQKQFFDKQTQTIKLCEQISFAKSLNERMKDFIKVFTQKRMNVMIQLNKKNKQIAVNINNKVKTIKKRLVYINQSSKQTKQTIKGDIKRIQDNQIRLLNQMSIINDKINWKNPILRFNMMMKSFSENSI